MAPALTLRWLGLAMMTTRVPASRLQAAGAVPVTRTTFPSGQQSHGLVHAVSPLRFAYVAVVDAVRAAANETAMRGELAETGCLGLKEWIQEHLGGPEERRRVAVGNEEATSWEHFWEKYGAEAQAPAAAEIMLNLEHQHYRKHGVTHGPAVLHCTLDVPELRAREVTWVQDRPRRFMACLPPLFTLRRVYWEWILAWIDYHAGHGLQTVGFYALQNGMKRLGPSRESSLRRLAEERGIEVIHNEFSAVVPPGVATWYHGQRESIYDCELQAQALGAEWALFCDWDEFLTLFPTEGGAGPLPRAIDGNLVEVVRAATTIAGPGNIPAAVTFGSWAGLLGECIGAGTDGAVNAAARAAAALDLAKQAGPNGTEPESQDRLLDRSRALADLVRREAFRRRSKVTCNPNAELMMGVTEMLCVTPRGPHQTAGHRKYMTRPGDAVHLDVHHPRLRDDLEGKRRLIHMSADVAHMLHLRGAALKPGTDVCRKVTEARTSYADFLAASDKTSEPEVKAA